MALPPGTTEEPGMSSEPQQKRSPVPWVAISVCAGAAFAIVALLNGPGIAYAIVAVVAGAAYSLVTALNRRGT
jgi:4-hydroxybenzoate polyprenyltransferase